MLFRSCSACAVQLQHLSSPRQCQILTWHSGLLPASIITGACPDCGRCYTCSWSYDPATPAALRAEGDPQQHVAFQLLTAPRSTSLGLIDTLVAEEAAIDAVEFRENRRAAASTAAAARRRRHRGEIGEGGVGGHSRRARVHPWSATKRRRREFI